MGPIEEKANYYKAGKESLGFALPKKEIPEAAMKSTTVAQPAAPAPVEPEVKPAAPAKAAEPAEMSGIERMEEHVMKTLYENNVQQENTMNGMMRGMYKECSYDEGTLTFIFPVQQWQANRVGNMHGGAIATAFDLTIAALARFYAGEYFAPTVSLDVKYIRPIPVGDNLIVKAKATATGKRITQLTAEAVVESTGKLAATAASVYLNIDTVKERAK